MDKINTAPTVLLESGFIAVGDIPDGSYVDILTYSKESGKNPKVREHGSYFIDHAAIACKERKATEVEVVSIAKAYERYTKTKLIIPRVVADMFPALKEHAIVNEELK